MPPVRTTKRSTSPAESSPSHQLTYASTWSTGPPSAPVRQSPETDASLSLQVTKKKRSHGKARPPGHIPRPPNAFIIFRTDYIRSMSTHSTPEMSKNLGKKWNSMTAEEKRFWNEKAEEAKAEHQIQNPGYRYKPIHRRDEKGNCIRKPRKPNKPRVKNSAGDLLEDLPMSFSWMEEKNGGFHFRNASQPSSISAASSPPRSPSPAAPLNIPQPSCQALRRSSSVPIPGSADRFCFGMPPAVSVYPTSPTGLVSRRLTKRPSTSMDFVSAGPTPPEVYSNDDLFLSPGDPSQWRLGHRRSLSAPGLGGEIPNSQFVYAPNHEEANRLTPINPVFGSVFDKFSWSTTSGSQNASADGSNAMLPHNPYMRLDIPIPSMSDSPMSNFSSITTPSICTPGRPLSEPAMQHPAPMSHFDFSAFREQIRTFDAPDIEHMPNCHPPFGHTGQDVFDTALGLVFPPSSYTSHLNQAYTRDGVQPQASEQPFYPVEAAPEHARNITQPYSEDSCLLGRGVNALTSDLRCYEEGSHVTQPQMALPRALDFNELIVEGYCALDMPQP